jgi:hypothetical protein
VTATDVDHQQMRGILDEFRNAWDGNPQQGREMLSCETIRRISLCPFAAIRAQGFIDLSRATLDTHHFELGYFYALRHAQNPQNLIAGFKECYRRMLQVTIEPQNEADREFTQKLQSDFYIRVSEDLTALDAIIAMVHQFRADHPDATRYPREAEILKVQERPVITAGRVVKAGFTLAKLGLAVYLTVEVVKTVWGWF